MGEILSRLGALFITKIKRGYIFSIAKTWTSVYIFSIISLKVNINKFKRGDSIPVFLGDSEETYLLILSTNGCYYEVQVKRRFRHEKRFHYGRIFLLEDSIIEEFKVDDIPRTNL